MGLGVLGCELGLLTVGFHDTNRECGVNEVTISRAPQFGRSAVLRFFAIKGADLLIDRALNQSLSGKITSVEAVNLGVKAGVHQRGLLCHGKRALLGKTSTYLH